MRPVKLKPWEERWRQENGRIVIDEAPRAVDGQMAGGLFLCSRDEARRARGDFVKVIDHGDAIEIAEVGRVSRSEALVGGGTETLERDIPRATLAAAAPELYRALETVGAFGAESGVPGVCLACRVIMTTGSSHTAGCVVGAALRKARGE